MTVEIISWSISTRVWDRAGIKLATPGSAVRHASVARHVTDCATRPSLCFTLVWPADKHGFDWPTGTVILKIPHWFGCLLSADRLTEDRLHFPVWQQHIVRHQSAHLHGIVKRLLVANSARWPYANSWFPELNGLSKPQKCQLIEKNLNRLNILFLVCQIKMG